MHIVLTDEENQVVIYGDEFDTPELRREMADDLEKMIDRHSFRTDRLRECIVNLYEHFRKGVEAEQP